MNWGKRRTKLTDRRASEIWRLDNHQPFSVGYCDSLAAGSSFSRRTNVPIWSQVWFSGGSLRPADNIGTISVRKHRAGMPTYLAFFAAEMARCVDRSR